MFVPSLFWLYGVGLNTLLLGISWFVPKKLLTPAGSIHAWFLGVLLWISVGWRAYLLVMFYFLVGSAVTKIGMSEKEALGIAEKRSGARGPENVWGSALSGSVCAVFIFLINLPDLNLGTLEWVEITTSLLLLGFVASFSTKLSDTCASEVGKAYGKSTFLITTLKPVPRGTEGAVSLEGTIAGIFASIAIALIGWSLGLIDVIGILWCAIAAFIATNLESVIGATLQSNYEWLTNELVNVINTAIGTLVAVLLGWLWLNFGMLG